MCKEMRLTVNDLVNALSVRGSVVGRIANGVRVSKTFGKRLISFELTILDGELWINPAKYEFYSKQSHFEYCETENRWTRRKSVIKAMVSILAKAGLWSFVSNKKFFELNDNNRHMNRNVAALEMSTIIHIKNKK